MSDVRDDVVEVIAKRICEADVDEYTLADSILERFDVTPKPVVTPEELGRMARKAFHAGSLVSEDERDMLVGKRMLDQIADAGLTLVRCGE